ncbi:MAG TPA: hypothetical protein PLX02_05545 [Syntrophorhabdaceae bacterium]|nr:hypothetical protein [Syntrophorhabdaceae bacterium]HQM81069.1 hypothetical protein [Syntrophorhabdaceae bacterium]
MKKIIKKNKLPPFVALPWIILNSQAYKDLPFSAAKALPYFLGNEETRKVAYNDPSRYDIPFAFKYSDAERFGFARRTFHQIISDLMKFGFIDPVTKGGKKGCGFTKSKFKLSLRWKQHGTPEFIEIRKWEHFPQQNPKVQGIHN